MPILDSRHDLAHPVGPDPAWSESYYFNCYDPKTRAGFVSRTGIRPHAGFMEAFTLLWLPDGGSAVLQTEQTRRDMPDQKIDAGAQCYTCEEPMRRWSVEAVGRTDTGQDVHLSAVFDALTPAIGIDAAGRTEGRDTKKSVSQAALASGHFEQSGRWRGTLDVDGRKLSFEGLGNRDKSWGARRTDGTRGLTHYRWFSINLGEDTHLGGIRLGTADGDLHRGWVWRSGAHASIRRLAIETRLADDGLTHQQILLEVTDKHDRVLALTGDVLRVAPLPLHESQGMAVLEGLVQWHGDGLEGHGIAEYAHLLDSDGRPVVPVQ
jgi:hypothetical protein